MVHSPNTEESIIRGQRNRREIKDLHLSVYDALAEKGEMPSLTLFKVKENSFQGHNICVVVQSLSCVLKAF